MSRENLRWSALSNYYLPCVENFWRFSRVLSKAEPRQGYKFHLSAHLLYAVELLDRVGPILKGRGLLFKAPRYLHYVSYLNAGIYFGFSQVGKVITVYPSRKTDIIELGDMLVHICKGISGPQVPSDFRLSRVAPVYVRYGAFARQEHDGSSDLLTPDGSHEIDKRLIGRPFPVWIKNPFPTSKQNTRVNPLMTRFLAYGALSQRGKGGVYQAIDVGIAPARLCVLKEARHEGELELDARSACARLRHEARVLQQLKKAKVNVPEVLKTFQLEGNHYLVMEHLAGRNLFKMLGRGALTEKQRSSVVKSLCTEVKKIHHSGWAWRDLKPSNIILAKNNKVYLVDFEGSCRLSSKTAPPWGTEHYIPSFKIEGPTPHQCHDVFALATTIEQILSDRLSPIRAHVELSTISSPLHELILQTRDPERLVSLTAAHFCEALELLSAVR